MNLWRIRIIFFSSSIHYPPTGWAGHRAMQSSRDPGHDPDPPEAPPPLAYIAWFILGSSSDKSSSQPSTSHPSIKSLHLYEHAWSSLNMQTLFDRIERKCLPLAKKCLRDVKLCKMLPLKFDESLIKKRKSEKYKVIKEKTCRIINSPIIYMQKLLNQYYEKK